MPKNKNKPIFNFNLPQYTQISESHCGPAVTQMLLSFLGTSVSQEAVAELGGAKDLIELNGMRVDQLALAVHKLAPQYFFWFKEHSTLTELTAIIRQHGYPVGVEWQGVFDDLEEDEEEDDDDDYGHYSVVIQVYPRKKELVIADPYKDYISQARVFSFQEFDQRWYDYNEIVDPKTGKAYLKKDDHMMFLITPLEEMFPLKFGMERYFKDEVQE